MLDVKQASSARVGHAPRTVRPPGGGPAARRIPARRGKRPAALEQRALARTPTRRSPRARAQATSRGQSPDTHGCTAVPIVAVVSRRTFQGRDPAPLRGRMVRVSPHRGGALPAQSSGSAVRWLRMTAHGVRGRRRPLPCALHPFAPCAPAVPPRERGDKQTGAALGHLTRAAPGVQARRDSPPEWGKSLGFRRKRWD